MIDVARVSASTLDRAIDHRFFVECKEEGMVPLHPRLVVPAIGFVIVDSLTGILDDSSAFTDSARREYSAAVDVRGAHYI
jgi:hypothetical protein